MKTNNIKGLPRVSVMIPVYNANKFIEECLDSILTQDYPYLELIVSDDCSTDSTQDVLRKYEKNPKVKILLNNKNLGITDNCNQALGLCTGEYIALFAGDDVMLPGKISTQVAEMLANSDVVLSYHAVEVFDSDSGEILYVSSLNKRDQINSVRDLLVKGGIDGGCSIMIKNSSIPIGGYDYRLPVVSDWLFQLEVAMTGKVMMIDKVMARYRKHGGGASQQTFLLLNESIYALDILLEKYPHVEEIESLVHRAKFRYVAGEVVRQLCIDPNNAFNLAKESISYSQYDLRGWLLVGFTWLNKNIPSVNSLMCCILKKFKYQLKKIFT